MRVCETCCQTGWTFHVRWIDGSEHDFDSFACALELLGPRCQGCGAQIFGRPLHYTTGVFCSDECVKRHFTRTAWSSAPGEGDLDSVGSTPPLSGTAPRRLEPSAR